MRSGGDKAGVFGTLRRYGVAAASIASASLLASRLGDFDPHFALLPLLAAVYVSAAYAGRAPGLLAAAAGCAYLVASGGAGLDAGAGARLALFAATSLLLVRLGGAALSRRSLPGFAKVARDVTERRRAEEALRRKQQDYESLVNSIDGIVWELDVGTQRFAFVSRQAERLLGYPVEGWYVDSFWSKHVHPDDREWAVAFCEKATAERRDHEFEYRMIAADGRTVWLRDIVAVLSEDGRPTKLRGVMIDITRRKQEDEERARLQTRLAAVEEEERRRIAAELHDRMGDALGRVRVEIERLKGERGPSEERREGTRRLEEVMKGLEQEIRHLVWELRPPALDKFGLASALENYVGEWSARNQVPVEFQATGFGDGERLPAQVETTLYRVAQEALTNVLKHSGATRVGVLLIRGSDGLRLLVEDDGRGCDPEAAREAALGSRSFGLTGMRERAETAGGVFGIESAPGEGCTVSVSVPLRQGGGVGSVREEAAHLSG